MSQENFTHETFQWLAQASTQYVILEPGDPSRLFRSINCFIFLGRLFCHLSWGQGEWLYTDWFRTSAHTSSTKHLAERYRTYFSEQGRMGGLVQVHRSWQKMGNIWLGLSADSSSLTWSHWHFIVIQFQIRGVKALQNIWDRLNSPH